MKRRVSIGAIIVAILAVILVIVWGQQTKQAKSSHQDDKIKVVLITDIGFI